MKTKITLFSCIVCFIAYSFPAFSQWVNCPNTSSLHGYSLGVKGSDIWAGTQGGLYKSTNNGASFSSSSSGIPSSSQISEIFVTGNTIFARKASNTDPLYRSIDNGSTWQLKNAGLTWTVSAPFSVSNMTQIGNTLFIGTSNGTYQSTDNGDNWSEVAGNWSTLGLLSKYVRVLRSNNGILYAGTIQGLFISNNNGITWTATGLNSNEEVNDVAFNGTDVFVCINNGDKIYRSTDNCVTFTSVVNPLPCNLIRKMVVAGGKIMAAADQGFLVYDINSETYTYENTGLTSNSVFSLVISDGNVYTGVQTQGIFKRALSDLGITSTLSIEEQELINVRIYPNPTHDIFQISVVDYAGLSADIYTINGQLMHSVNLTSNQTQVDISTMNTGMYFMYIRNNKGYSVTKIIKD